MLDLMDAKRRQNIYSRLHFTPAEWYKGLASSCNFSVKFKSTFDHNSDFENIDAAMNFWYGVTRGGFDPKLADKEELEKFKQTFGEGPVQFYLCRVVFMILQK